VSTGARAAAAAAGALACAALVGACAQYTLVGTERRSVGGAFSVAPQIEWSAFEEGPLDVWTVDGTSLQSVRFATGLEDGASLFRPRGADSPMPAFRSDMTAIEVMELVVESLKRVGAANVRAHELRPAAFGTLSGFRFDLTLASQEGLEYRGLATGAVGEGRLLLVLFLATREHYFERYRPPVERMLESIRVES